MTELNPSLNPADMQITLEPYNPAPNGRHNMRLSGITPVYTKFGKSMRFTFTIKDGPHMGYIASFMGSTPATPGNKLGKFLQALGVNTQVVQSTTMDPRAFLNREYIVDTIQVIKNNNTYAQVSAVYLAAPSAAPAQPAAPPAYVPPAAATNAAPLPPPPVTPPATDPIIPPLGPSVKW